MNTPHRADRDPVESAPSSSRPSSELYSEPSSDPSSNPSPGPSSGKKVGALVLAAGFSRRFGASKLLAKLPDKPQVSLLEQTLTSLSAALPSIVVVYRPELRDQFLAIGERVQTENPDTALSFSEFDDAAAGMGASLAHCANSMTDWAAALVCLADMPYIRPSTYSLLAKTVTSDTIVAPYFNTARGHPIAFGSTYFDELRALSGDEGARSLLNKHRAKTLSLAVDDNGILIDIDTKEDLNRRL